jgi:indolepyruvate ferredoxin oxidoreductase alpha subunit
MVTTQASKRLMSGNEAVALGALHASCARGAGYPGTPSTEILEHFSILGGHAEWAPNEKIAADVALGVSFAGARALVTTKHVGLNVAADTLFTAAYTGVAGGFVLAVADDPGMASSQNEQDSRRYALAAGAPMLEPSDPQDAYELTRLAFEVSERWRIPALLRLTTRVSHTTAPVQPRADAEAAPRQVYERRVEERVMVPLYARPAHGRLRAKLAAIRAWCEKEGPVVAVRGTSDLAILTAGVSYLYAREAFPDASFLKLGMTHPLPTNRILGFIAEHGRCVVVEENDPYLVEQIRAVGGRVPWTPESFRFGELNVDRVRRLAAGVGEAGGPKNAEHPPRLCAGCSHGEVFKVLKKNGCIVAGDIGCYALAALPPLQGMDCQLSMGTSIGAGLGLRHALPADQARKVVSVIGDSTLIHAGLPGIVEMVYNPPSSGHVVVILDNRTTAMTGHQEHPGTGRRLNGEPAHCLAIEDVVKAMGVRRAVVVDPVRETAKFEAELVRALQSDDTTVIVARHPCLLAGRRPGGRGCGKAAP